MCDFYVQTKRTENLCLLRLMDLPEIHEKKVIRGNLGDKPTQKDATPKAQGDQKALVASAGAKSPAAKE